MMCATEHKLLCRGKQEKNATHLLSAKVRKCVTEKSNSFVKQRKIGCAPAGSETTCKIYENDEAVDTFLSASITRFMHSKSDREKKANTNETIANKMINA